MNVTPGADVGFVLASGLRGGKRRGIAAALGISLGSLLHTALAAMGVAAMLHSHVWAYDALRYLGAVYLAVLAWRAWVGAGAPLSARGATGMRRAVTQGFMTNILNPKVALFILAFLPQFTNPAVGPVWQQMLLLGGLFHLVRVWLSQSPTGCWRDQYRRIFSITKEDLRKFRQLHLAGSQPAWLGNRRV